MDTDECALYKCLKPIMPFNNMDVCYSIFSKKISLTHRTRALSEKNPEPQVISASIAKRMQKILIKIVQQGTGKVPRWKV